MNPKVETIAAVVGVLTSLLMAYLPKFKDWFENLDSLMKRLFQLMLAAIIVSALYGLACAGRTAILTCDNDGLWDAVQIFVFYAIANQSTYTFIKRTPKKYASSDDQMIG